MKHSKSIYQDMFSFSDFVLSIPRELFYVIFAWVVLAYMPKQLTMTFKFNESSYVRGMAQISFIFFIFRVIVFSTPNAFWVYPDLRDNTMSIILSLDVLASMGVYFFPKLHSIYTRHPSGMYKSFVRPVDQHHAFADTPSASGIAAPRLCQECQQNISRLDDRRSTLRTSRGKSVIKGHY